MFNVIRKSRLFQERTATIQAAMVSEEGLYRGLRALHRKIFVWITNMMTANTVTAPTNQEN